MSYPTSVNITEKTLRDEFAMAALTGLISAPEYLILECAGLAYKYADAMLEERCAFATTKVDEAKIADLVHTARVHYAACLDETIKAKESLDELERKFTGLTHTY